MNKLFKSMRLLLAALMMIPATGSQAAVEKASDITPPVFNRSATSRQEHWFADADQMLSRAKRKDVDAAIKAARESADLDLVAVLVKDYKGDIKQLAKDIHDQWNLGALPGVNDNGVVLLVVAETHNAYIYSGLNARNKLSDTASSLIVSRRMAKLLNGGKYTDAIISGANSIAEVVGDPGVVETMKGEPEISDDVNVWLIGGLCGLALLIAVVMKLRKPKDGDTPQPKTT